MNIQRAKQWMAVAEAIAKMSTCPRRDVGAIILDKRGHVLSTGFNGVPSKFNSCKSNQCEGSLSPPGDNLDKCMAVHAEQNALIQGNTREAKGLITTASPCKHCIKMLLNTPIQYIVYKELYDLQSIKLWTDSGRRAMHV